MILQRAPVSAKLHLELIPRYMFTHIKTGESIPGQSRGMHELVSYKNNFCSRIIKNDLT